MKCLTHNTKNELNINRYFQVKFEIDLYLIYNKGKLKIKTNVSILKLIL